MMMVDNTTPTEVTVEEETQLEVSVNNTRLMCNLSSHLLEGLVYDAARTNGIAMSHKTPLVVQVSYLESTSTAAKPT